MDISEIIAGLAPKTYYRQVTTLPPLDKAITVLVVSDDTLVVRSELDGKVELYTSDINIYVRLDGKRGNSSETKKDLKNLWGVLEDRVNDTLQNYRIISVEPASISTLGRDESNNFLFSMNFRMRYSEV